MKKFIKVFMVIALVTITTLSPLSGVKRVSANADTDYLLNYYGLTESDCEDQTVVFNGSKTMAYYSSKGNTATTGVRFKTIGVKVTCLKTGETTSIALGSDGTIFSNESEADGFIVKCRIKNGEKNINTFRRTK